MLTVGTGIESIPNNKTKWSGHRLKGLAPHLALAMLAPHTQKNDVLHLDVELAELLYP